MFPTRSGCLVTTSQEAPPKGEKSSKRERFTGEEGLHDVAVRHLEQAAARVRGKRRVGAVRQQEPHDV